MDTTYDVRIWKTGIYHGKKINTYYVRWQVAGKRWKKPFKGRALADGFRSVLVTAVRKGEAFDISTGLPISIRPHREVMTWYTFTCRYIDLKWPHVPATTRRTNAEALTAVTMLMLTEDTRGRPENKTLRTALQR